MGLLTAKRVLIFLAIVFVIVAGIIYWRAYFSTPSNLIVLLTDPSGKLGAVEVGNDAGRQLLSKEREATGASSATQAPRAPFVMTEEEINEIFGDVLAGRPALPVSFTLNFQPGTSILVSAGAQIDEILAEIQRRPVSSVAIFGYADTTGNIPLNLGSALFRARAVRDALASRGLQTSNFLIDSIVDPNPPSAAAGGNALPNNRRVEVVIR